MKRVKYIIISALVPCALGIGSSASAEQIPGTQLEVHMERANIGGVGRSVVVRRVPVRNQVTGDTKFYDISFQATSDSAGNLQFEAINQIDVTPQFPIVSALVAGRFADQQGNVYELAGPSIDAQGFENYSLDLVMAAPDGGVTELSVSLSGRSFDARFPDIGTDGEGVRNAELLGDLTGTLSTQPTFSSTNRWFSGSTNNFGRIVSANASSADRLVFSIWSGNRIEGTITLNRQVTP